MHFRVLLAAQRFACAVCTAVDGRSTPSMAVDRDRTFANARDGLKNLALLVVRTSSTAYAHRRPPTLADTSSVTLAYEYYLNISITS